MKWTNRKQNRGSMKPVNKAVSRAAAPVRRKLVETLEKRQYFSGAVYGGLTFTPTDSGAATETTDLTALFTNGHTAGNATSVVFAGNITDGSHGAIAGNFNVSDNSGTYSVKATSLSFSYDQYFNGSDVGTLFSTTGGSATLALTTTALTGSITGFTIGSGSTYFNLSSMGLNWNTSGNLQVVTAAGSATVETGQSFDGNFAFTRQATSTNYVFINVPGGDVNIAITNAAINLGAGVMVTGMSGDLDWNNTGFSGTGNISNASFTSDGATFSGTLGFSVNTQSGSDKNIQVTASQANLTVGGVTFTTDAKIESVSAANNSSGGSVGAELSNVTLTIGNGNAGSTFLSANGGNASTSTALFQNNTFIAVVGVNAAVNAPSGVTVSGTMVLEVNTGSSSEQLPDPTNTSNSITVPAGPIVNVQGNGITLHISSTQTVTGDFGFAYDSSDAAGSKTLVVSATAVNATFGSASINNASGSLTIGDNGANGSFIGAANFASGGISSSGLFQANITTGAVAIYGSNIAIQVDGEYFSGNFAVSDSATSTSFNVSGASLSFGGGSISVTDLSGSFTVDNHSNYSGGVTGTLSGSYGSTNIDGSVTVNFGSSHVMTLSGTNDTISSGDQSVSGSFALNDSNGNVSISATSVTGLLGGGLVNISNGTLAANISNGAFSGTVSGNVSAGSASSVAFSGPIAVNLSQGAIVASSGGGVDTLTVGGQNFSAGFLFSEDAAGNLQLSLAGINVSIGSGANTLTASNTSGTLLVTSAGMSGTLAATLSSSIASFSGNLGLTFGGGNVSVTITNGSLTINDNTITGTMTVTQNGSNLSLAATSLSASLAGGLVKISPPAAGTIVPASTLQISGGQISGNFSGIVSAGTSETGASFSGLVSVGVSPTAVIAGGTNDTLTVGSNTISGNFAFQESGSTFQLGVSQVNFSLGSMLSIAGASGWLTVANTGITGSASGNISSGIGNFNGNLGLAFAPGLLQLSGTNDSLSYGDQSLSGSFVFTKNGSGMTLTSSNLAASLGGGLVSVTGGSAALFVSASGQVTGNFSGNVSAGSSMNSSGVGFAGPIAVSVTGSSVSASGNGDTLTVAGQSFSASFNFFENAGGLNLQVSGISFAMGSVLSVAGASGTLNVTSAGVSGSTSGTVTSTIAGFSGKLGMAFGGGTTTVTGTNDAINIAGQSINGNFVFTSASGGNLNLAISSLNVSLGGGLVTLGGQNGVGASANLNISSGGAVSGSFSGYLNAGSASSVSFSGGIAVAISGGNITFNGTGDSITVAGQTLSGNFGFAEDVDGKTLDLTMSGASLSVGNAISVTNASGTVNIAPGGASGNVSGSISSTIAGLTVASFGVTFAPGALEVVASGASLNIGGQSISGDFDFSSVAGNTQMSGSNLAATLGGGLVVVNNGSGALSVSNAGVITGSFTGGVSAGTSETAAGFSGLISVHVASGAITASGTNDVLTFGGYSLATNFNFSDTAGVLNLGVDHLNFSLGSALTISNASGTLVVAAGDISGTAAGTVSSSFSNVSISGNLGVAFGGGAITISGTNDALRAGNESISGDFSFTKDANGIELTSSNLAASLGNGLVTVTNGSGNLAISGGTVAGAFAGTIAAGTVGGGVSFGGPISVSVGSGVITASTPAGSVDTITIGGQTVSAGFVFSDSNSGLSLSLSNVNLSLGGGAVSLSNGSGQLSINSSGVSGSASGTLASSFSGFTFTGNLAASFAPGVLSLSGTGDKLTAGDQIVSGDFAFASNGSAVSLSASNFAASLGGGLVTVSNGSGSLSISGGNVTGSFAGTLAAGTAAAGLSGNISVTVAPGQLTATGTNDTLTVGSNSITAGFHFYEDANGLELTVSNVNLNLGSGLIGITNAGGTLLVSKSGVSGSIYGGLTASVPNVTFNSTNFGVAFGGGSLTVGGTGVSLTAYGQQIGGNFSFTQAGSNVSLAISNLNLSIGGVVNVTNGIGNFQLSNGGMTGAASGTVSVIGSSNIVFTGNYGVAVGNGAVKVSGTNDKVSIYGQSLSGNFSFSSSGNSADLHVSSLNLSMGNGLVLVSGGAADFTVSNGAITGTASGNLSVGSSETGVSFSGLVGVAITSTGVTVSGTGCTLMLGSTALTADLVFSKDTTTGALDVAISNLTLATDSSSPSVVVSGTLQILPTGMSGTLTGTGDLDGVTGTITATFANGTYTIDAGISTSFSETIDGASISGTVNASGTTAAGGSGTIALTDLMVSLGNGLLTISGGNATLTESGGKLVGAVSGTVNLNGVSGVSLGGDVSLTFTTNSLTVTGTNDSLTVLGQSVAGSFTFSDANGAVALGVSNLSVALASTVSLTNGSGNFLLSNGGMNGSGTANVAINTSGISFASTMGLSIDTTNGHSTFTVAGNPATITVGNESLTGNFAFSKFTTSTGLKAESLSANGINIYLGDGNTGVQISNASGAILFLPTGVAMDISGGVALVGISGLTLGGTLDVRYSNLGSALNETIPVPDPAHPGQTVNDTLKFTANENDISGTATLAVGSFVSVTGGFSISQQKTTTAGVTTSKLLIGAAGINATLGSSVGVQVTNANLGLVITSKANASSGAAVGSSTYAMEASGNAALFGVTGLTLSGNLAVEANTAGAITQEIDVPDPKNPGSTIPVNVNYTTNVQGFAGTGLTLAVMSGGNTLVSLGGDFGFSKSGSVVDVTAANASAFVGSGGVGLQLSGGTLGLVLASNGYALDAGGNVALVGLPGLNVAGNLDVTVNTTGNTVVNPQNTNNSIAVNTTPVVSVSGLNFTIDDSSNAPVLSITVDATISKLGSVTDINATSAELALYDQGSQLIDVQGSVDLTLGANGFQLGPNGFNVSSFSLLGGSSAAPSSLIAGPMLATPLAAPAGPTSTGTTGTITAPATPTGNPWHLGPLDLYHLRPTISGFGYANNTLTANVGLKADAAVLKFGSNSSNGGTQAILSTLAGSLQLTVGVDPAALKVTSFGATGKFDLSAGSFWLNVPDVVNVTASNIDISYDPNASSSQKIISIGTATVTVPFGSGGNGITGKVAPYTDPSTGVTIPGLVVYGDHFQLGTGTIQYNGTLSLGSVASFTNPFVSISNLSANFSGGIAFNGSITIGAGKVVLGTNSFQFSGSGVAATLTKTNGNYAFSFSANSLAAKLGPVTLSASNVLLNPYATGSQQLFSVNELGASLTLPSVTISGTAGSATNQKMAIDGDGTIEMPNDFTIDLSVGAGSSGQLGWPSWLPIQVSSVVLAWQDFNTDKTDFTMTFSATMNAKYGLISLQGSLTNITVDIGKLIAGDFPIVGIQAASISASGEAFGGELSGGLVLGTIHMDAFNHAVAYGQPYDHSIFYAGIEGQLSTPEGGFGIRFGMTQNGPLQAYIDVQAPIEIFPPADIAITQLYGGITFDAAPLPTISQAIDLESGVFSPGYQLTTPQWEIQLQQETILQSGGGSGGYIFSLTAGVGGIQSDLDAAIADSALATDFLNQSDPLSGVSLSGTPVGSMLKTQVIVEQAGHEWLLIDGSNFYLLTKNALTGQIDVSKEQFAIDSQASGSDTTVGATIAELVADLNSGIASQELINAFAAYRIGIDSKAVITPMSTGSVGAATSAWLIKDNGYTYQITKDAYGVLGVLQSGGSMSAMNGSIQIEASVQLGFGGTNGNGISATGDVIIDTSGKILLNAYVDFGAQNTGSFDASLAINFRCYIDLSGAASYGDAKAYFLYQELVPEGNLGQLAILTVAAGATFAHTDSLGDLILPNTAFANATPAGFGIALDGTIIVQPINGATLTLNGSAELAFFSDHCSLSFDATLSANIENFIQADNVVTAAGAFTFYYGSSTYIYGAAELIFDSGAIPFLESAGITDNAVIFLRINTDSSSAHTINFDMPTPGNANSSTPMSIDLNASSFGLFMVGELSFAKGPVNFELAGVFDVDFEDVAGDWQFNVFAFAELNVGVAGESLLTMDALGLLQINNHGFAAMLAVQSNSSSSVLDFQFNLSMYVNTESQAVTYTMPNDLVNIIEQVDTSSFSGNINQTSGAPALNDALVKSMQNEIYAITGTNQNSGSITLTIPAGMPIINQSGGVTGHHAASPYMIIQGYGDLKVLNQIDLTGDLQIQATPDGVGIAVDASLTMGPLLHIAASGILDITTSGLVAAVTLAGDFQFGSAIELFTAASLEINTTGVDQTVQEYTFDTSTKSISSSTTAHTIPGTDGQGNKINYLAIDAVGELSILNSFNINGSFMMSLAGSASSYTLNIAVTAHVDAFFGITLDVIGAAQIDTQGDFAMAIATNVSMGIPSIFNITGDAIVEINSNSSNSVSLPVPGHGSISVAPGGHIHLDASVHFLSLVTVSIAADATYNAITHDFTLAFYGSASLNLFVFSGSLAFGGWIDSSGQFAVGFSGGFNVNFGIGHVSGSAYVGLAWSRTAVQFDTNSGDYNYGLPVQNGSNNSIVPITPISYNGTPGLTVTGDVDLSGSVLGIGVDINGSIYYSSVSGELSVHTEVTISFFFFSISVGVTIDLGNLDGQSPPMVYLAGTPYAATVDPGSFTGGPLVLNVGARATNRNFNNSDSNETVVVMGGSDWSALTGTQTIYVTVDGYSQAFAGVSKVTIPGDGSNTIEIANSVHVPIYASAGGIGQNSTIIDAGSGNATLVGGAGNDVIEAGSGNATLIGNGGNDTLVAGTGNDSVTTTGTGASQILWNADQDGALSLMGDNNGDDLVATTDTPGTTYAGGENITLSSPLRGVSTISGTRGVLATFQRIKTLLVNAPGGDNQIAIGDMTGSGITTLNLIYGQSHNAGDSLNITGAPGTDTLTLSSGVAALPTLPTAPPPTSTASPAAIMATPAGMMASPAAAIGGNNVQTVTIDNSNGLTITIMGSSAGAGDSLNMNSGGGTTTYNVQSVVIPTTLNGGTTTGSTTYYYIGAQPNGSSGSLSGINSTLNIDGTNASSDVVVLLDTGDSTNRTFDLTSTQAITDATGSAGKIYYNSGIDNLDLDAGPGQNSYVVKGTAASTLTQILTGNSDNSFVINGPITNPLALDGGASLFGQNTLTVNGSPTSTSITVAPGLITGDGANIYYTNMDGLTVNGGNTGTAFTLNGSLVPVTLLGGTGNDSFTLQGDSSPVNIDSGAGVDSFTINGNSAPSTIRGEGSDSFNIESNSASLIVTGGNGQDVFNVDANTGNLALNGGNGNSNFNTYNIFGNSGILDINSNGSSQYNIANVASPVTINGQSTASTYFITAPLSAPVTITGNATLQNLVLLATVGDDNITITPTQILGVGAAINYSGFQSITIVGNGGDDTINILGTSAATTITTTAGNAAVNVQSLSNALTINNTNGTGNYTISNSGLLGGIAAPITVNGTGNDTLTLDDSADGLAQSGQITNTTVAGMGMNAGGFITYTGLDQLNISLGNGVQTVAVASTAANAPVNLTTGAGSDNINVTSINSALSINAGAGTNAINIGNNGILSGIKAAINIDGGGQATLSIDDHADTQANQTGNITATTVTGLGMNGSGITYTNLSNLNVLLGSGGNGLNIASTSAASTQINGGNGGDDIAITAATGALTIIAGNGTNVITAGDLLSNFQGGLTVVGNGTTSLTVDDSADTSAQTGAMNATQITGLGMGSLGVTYSGITSLDVNLGSGSNTFTIEQTGNATTLNGGSGNDSVFVQQTTNPVMVNVGTGINQVTLGNPQINGGDLLAGILGKVTITGGGTDTINLDDTANTTPNTGTINATTITGLAPATIDFSGEVSLANLNIALGDAGNTLTIANTPSTATTSINTGDGNNTITLQSTSGATNVYTGSGNSNVAVQGTNAPTRIQTNGGSDTITVTSASHTLAGIQGALTIVGDSTDTLTLNNTGDTLGRSGMFGATAITGLGMGANGVAYQGVGTVNLQLGSGGTALNVVNTAATTSTNITGTTGNDTITLTNDSGTTAITAGAGHTAVTVLATGAATTITGGNTTVGAGDLAGITGGLTINSTGTLTVNDSTATAGTAFLTGTQLAGLSPAAIHYANQSNLTLDLPGGLLTIANTSVPTTVNGGGASTVVVDHNANPATINTAPGVHNWVNVQTTGAAVTVNSGAGATDAITLTNSASMTGINAPVVINGNGNDALTLDDSADTGNRTVAITDSTITGIAPALISYNQLGTLNVLLGTGIESTTISNTNAATATTINGGTGSNTFAVQNDSGALTLNGQGTHNTLQILGTGASTTYNALAGSASNITIGNGGLTAGIAGTVNLNGAGNDALIINDTADSNPVNVTLTSAAITGIAPATINYSGLATLGMNLGNAGNDLTIAGTSAAPTSINTGNGDDSTTVQSTTGALSLNTAGGNNNIDISGADETLAGINGPVGLLGHGFDHLTVDDTADTANRSAIITAGTITGLSTGAIGYTGVSSVAVSLGSGVNTAAIPSTNLHTNTSINPGTGTVTVGSNGLLTSIAGPLTVFGNGQTNLTLTDGSDATTRTVAVNANNITGLAPVTIAYNQLADLNLQLGSGTVTTNINNTAASTNITGGTGSNTFNVLNDTAPLTITGNGTHNTVSIKATGGQTNYIAGNASVANILISNNGSDSSIAGPVNITGAGSDMLSIDDTADTTSRNVTLTSNTITGVSPAPISYSGLAALSMTLDNAGNGLSIINTAAGTPTTIGTGTGNDAVTITNTASSVSLNTSAGNDTVAIADTGGSMGLMTGDGDDTVTIAETGAALSLDTGNGNNSVSIANTGGDLSVNAGNGNDTLIVGNTGAPLTLNAGDGDNTVMIQNTGAAATVNTGSGNDNVTVMGTAGNLSLDTGAGDDAVSIQGSTGTIALNTGSGTNAVNISNLPAIHGAVAVAGDGQDLLTIDDTANHAAQSAVITNNSITNLSPAGITYSGVATLNVDLGNAGNSAAVISTNAATTTNLDAGSGASGLVVSNAGRLNAIAGPLNITGHGSTGLTLNDSTNTAAQSDTLTSTTFSGSNPATIAFNGLGSLNVLLGSGGNQVKIANTIQDSTSIAGDGGNDTIAVNQTSGPLSIRTGNGNDLVSILNTTGPVQIQTGAGASTVSVVQSTGSIAVTTGTGPTQVTAGNDLGLIAGLLSISGNGATNLTLDDSGSAAAKTGILAGNSLTGLNAGGVDFTNLANLNLQLSSGNDSLKIAATTANTTIGAGSSVIDVVTTNGTASTIQSPLLISGGSLSVDDSADSVAQNVALSDTAITGLGAPISYSNVTELNLQLGQSNDALSVSAIANGVPTTVDGGIGQNSATLRFNGDYTGNLSLKNFQGGSLSVSGNYDGTLTTDGSLNSVAIGGTVNNGSTLAVAGNIAQLNLAGGDSGSITSGSTNGGLITNATPDANGLVFSVTAGGITRSVYALSANGQPLVGVTFDIVYDASTTTPSIAIQVNNANPSAERFDLIVNSTGGGTTNLASLTSVGDQAGVRNLVVNGSLLTGGIVLPNDNLAAISFSGNIPMRSINVASIQALGFSSLTGLHNRIAHASGNFLTKAFQYAFALNLSTGAPVTSFVPVTEMLRMITTPGTTSGLYVVGPNKKFDTRGVLVSASLDPILTSVNFATDARHRLYVASLQLAGNGGSVATPFIVRNLASSGTLNNLSLTAGKTQQLDSLSAASITGNIDLHGGTLTGLLQTTGVQTDWTTGDVQNVSAELGSLMNGHASALKLAMAPSASIVSRGDLISQVQVTNAFHGTIAAAGNIGTAVTSSNGSILRYGGIRTGRGTATGQIIALGNIFGNVTIAGSLTGQIAAQGQPSATQSGIVGQINIAGPIAKTGGVVSGGEIGDAHAVTSLTSGKVIGQIIANGTVRTNGKAGTSLSHGKPPTVGEANPGQVWNVASGSTITSLDSTGDGQNLGELSALQSRLRTTAGQG